MSTIQPVSPQSPLGSSPPPAVGPGQQASCSSSAAPLTTDPQLIEETRQQIRGLVREIAQLGQSDLSLADYYEGFLGRVVSALAAVGGAIWTVGEGGRLELQYQINLQRTGLGDDPQRQMRHVLLLKKALVADGPMLVGPQSGPAGDEEAGNPTDFLLVLGTVKIDQDVRGVVEIFQRPGGGPTTQRGYLRFLVQMCDLVSDVLKSRRLRHYNDRQSLWQQLEKFIRAVHRSLDPHRTAYTIANEGRRLIDCDRVSVALNSGRECSVEAISGVDTVNRRASTVTGLERLVTAVVAVGEPVWYTGSCDDMPPQIEETLQPYVDRAHSKLLAVVPLASPAGETETADCNDRRRIIGALVVERMDNALVDDGLRQRVEAVAQHSSSALANAQEHDGLFLMPLWRALGKAAWVLNDRTFPKTVVVLVSVIAAVLAMVLIPAGFELEGRGVLQPVVRRDIFVGIDGVVNEVTTWHGQNVKQGQQLVRLRNTDLEIAIEDLIGERTRTREQILSVQRVLLGENRLSPHEQNRLSGQLLGLKETAESLDKQLALVRQKETQLSVRSPIAGQVVTWQVRDTLIHRPVEKGQVLVTVVDPDSDWELEIHMPERRMGHVARSWQRSPDGLKTTFVLATHPDKQFEGLVTQIHAAAEVHGEQSSTVLIRVAIDKSKLPDLRPGATVTAQIDCGRRPIGYVWFHDVISLVQSKVSLWF